MIDLNEHAQKAQEIAFNRWRKQKNEARAMEGQND